MFSTTTRLLIRWARGLISVGDAGAEQFIEMAGVQDYDQAHKLGEDILEAHRTRRDTTSVSGHVHTPAQQPGAGFYLGDRLDGLVVQSIAIGFDDEANTVVTPELGDPLDHKLNALNRRIARASSGSTSEFASPHPPGHDPDAKIDNTPPVFSYRWPRQPAATGGEA
jgi:hypothetical protein